jgi:hypothetical protein
MKILTIILLSLSITCFSQIGRNHFYNTMVPSSSSSSSSSSGGGSIIVDTIGRVNFTYAPYTKFGWTNVTTVPTGDVTLSYGVVMNILDYDGDFFTFNQTGSVWPDTVTRTATYLFNSANNVANIIFKYLGSFDSVRIILHSGRPSGGSVISNFKWGYNGTPYSIDSYNNTSILSTGDRIPTGTDTFKYYNTGANYAYLNGLKIIGYTH